MPVQINEIIIRTVVDATPAAAAPPPAAAATDPEEIVEQLLEILQEKTKR